jgi:hypothetical protein
LTANQEIAGSTPASLTNVVVLDQLHGYTTK